MSEVAQVTMDADSARRLTERIRIAAVNYSEAKEKLLHLVSEAKDGSAHVALGYKSWTAYLADVMSEEPLRLARDERREVVQLLSDEGMSNRAIAPIVGSSEPTVRRDVQAAGASVDAPVGNPTPALSTATPKMANYIADEERWEKQPRQDRPAPTPITGGAAEAIKDRMSAGSSLGMDGKSYPRPEPKPESAKPKAEPIITQFSTAVVELNKVLNKFHRIQGSDNFPANKNQVATLHGSDLARAISELQNLADQLH